MPVTYSGRTQTYKQWSLETGIGMSTIQKRILLGWPPGEALGYESHIRRESKKSFWTRNRRNHQIFFTPQNIRDMRELKEIRGWSCPKIAEKFGIDRRSVWNIVKRNRWKDIY